MLRDITLGQYFPGNSVIHKLDPRMKLILSIVYIVMLFSAKTLPSFAIAAVTAIVLVALSRIRVKVILKSLKPVLFIVLFTAVMNLLWGNGERVIFHFWKITIYYEGVLFALLMMLRISLLIAGTFVILTYTTSPVALTDAIENLTKPLSKIGVPTHEFAMMMSIALRFIPTLIEETDKIMCAQKARGADFETGGLVKRVKALVPVLIPLFISSFRRADELASAMECRLYHGGNGRTRMNVLHFSARDFVTLGLFLLGVVGVFVCNAHFEVLL